MSIKSFIRPALLISGGILVGYTSFPLFLDRLNFNNNKEDKKLQDIPDEEVDPEYE